MAHYWIKLYHEILNDPKMGRLSDRVWRRAVELFLLAGETGDSGQLPTMEDIAWRLRIAMDELQQDIEDLISVGVLARDLCEGLYVVNFAKRQGPVPGKERAAQCRKRQQQVEYAGEADGDDNDENGNEPVTKRDKDSDELVTNCDADIESDIESETDIEPETEVRAAGAQKQQPAPSPPSESKGNGRLTEGQRRFLAAFGAKRFRTPAQFQAVAELERQFGTDTLLEAATWAAERGMTVGGAVGACKTALPNWGKPKVKATATGPPTEPVELASGLGEQLYVGK